MHKTEREKEPPLSSIEPDRGGIVCPLGCHLFAFPIPSY